MLPDQQPPNTTVCVYLCVRLTDVRYEAVLAEFGGKVVRVKNGYSPDADPSVSYHYRGLLMNIEWHTGVTYGEVCETSFGLHSFEVDGIGPDGLIQTIWQQSFR